MRAAIWVWMKVCASVALLVAAMRLTRRLSIDWLTNGTQIHTHSHKCLRTGMVFFSFFLSHRPKDASALGTRRRRRRDVPRDGEKRERESYNRRFSIINDGPASFCCSVVVEPSSPPQKTCDWTCWTSLTTFIVRWGKRRLVPRLLLLSLLFLILFFCCAHITNTTQVNWDDTDSQAMRMLYKWCLRDCPLRLSLSIHLRCSQRHHSIFCLLLKILNNK